MRTPAPFCICGCPSSAHVNDRCRTRFYAPDGPHRDGLGLRYWLCECGGYVADVEQEEVVA